MVKYISLVLEGRFGMGMIEEVEGLELEYEEGRVVNYDEGFIDCVEEVKEEGGMLYGCGDDGLEYVVGEEGKSWEELWGKMREGMNELYGGGVGDETIEDEWLKKIVDGGGKLVRLY